MSTGSLYKLGDGVRHQSNCFPIHEFFRHRQDGVGHWLVAHRETVEQKRRDIRRFQKICLDQSPGSACATPATGNTLDGSLLMRLHCVEDPSDLCSIDISEQKLTLVRNEDFKDFDNIVYINASDNSLSIVSFRCFGLLRELDLSFNGCCDMMFQPDDFPHLEVLDLSFNDVSKADIVCIGRLAVLKVLYLTGNRLRHLPANMAGSQDHASVRPTDKAKPLFGALEVLALDENRLSSDVFQKLATFPRLQHLRLQGNNISEIPVMLPGGDVAKTWSNQGPFFRILQPSVSDQQSSPPLPQLRFLNLAHNKIAEEEDLLAAALFPNLTELVIHNNPLTTQRAGDPPLLTSLLSIRHRVKLKRTDQRDEKVSLMLPDIFKHKVRNEGRKQKKPRFKEKYHDSRQERESQDLPNEPNSSGTKDLEKNKRDGVMGCIDETEHHAKSVFVTQPLDHRNKELASAAPASSMTAGGLNAATVATNSSASFGRTGIQTAVRMLEQALKSVLMYREANTRPPGRHKLPERRGDRRGWRGQQE